MARTLAALIVGSLMLCAGVRKGHADLTKAAEHFDRGTRLYQVGEYAQALEEFKAGHVAEPDPSFIYNIAQCHRQLGHTKEAATSYKRFLALDPETSLRADVERKIAALEELLRKETPAPALPATKPPPAANSGTADVSVGQTNSPHPPAEKGSTRSLWPLWVGGALTLAFAGGALALGHTTNKDYDQLYRTCGSGGETGEGCPEDQINRIKTRALIVNALWGAAGVTAVVTGVGLFLGGQERGVSVSFAF